MVLNLTSYTNNTDKQVANGSQSEYFDQSTSKGDLPQFFFDNLLYYEGIQIQ